MFACSPVVSSQTVDKNINLSANPNKKSSVNTNSNINSNIIGNCGIMVANGSTNSNSVEACMATPLMGPTTSSVNAQIKPNTNEKKANQYKSITIDFNSMANGMDFLSMATGVTAKDKRIKDAKNQAVVHNKDDEKHLFNKFSSKKSRIC